MAPDPRATRMRRYLVRSSQRALYRLMAIVTGLVWIAILLAGFILAALFALDLSHMLIW